MIMKLTSILEELKLCNFNIETSELVKQITNKFKQDPNIPGVILRENNQLIGMLSQKSFWQYMSRPYSLEISAKRPVKYLLDFINVKNSLILSKDTLIVEAAKKSLQRSAKLLDEPIIVEVAPQEYRLLDAHQLLVAYAEIYELTNELLTQMYNQLEKANQKLEIISRIDELTGLANRKVFNEYLHGEWERALQKKTSISLIISDLDFFTEYNYSYGSIAGDKLLRKVANLINNSLKGMNCLAARYEGVKFAIIMPNTSAVLATCLVEDIRHQLNFLAIANPISPISNYLTLSFGIASMIPSSINSAKTLRVAADLALYRATQAGRNCQVAWQTSQKSDCELEVASKI